MTNLTVSDISARSPDMSERDFDAFVADIKANGQLVPIWVRGDEVIDGRKRLAACRRLGIEPKCVNLDPSQDAEAVSSALNLLRTHYSPAQIAMFAAERVTATKADNKKNSNKNNGDPAVSAPDAAKLFKAPLGTVLSAKRVINHGAVELIDAVKTGVLSLHSAERIAVEVPKPDQPAAVAKFIEASKGKARHTPVAKVLGGVDVRKDRARKYPEIEQFSRCIEKIEDFSGILTGLLDAAMSDIRRAEFAERLRKIRTLLSQSISRMEKAA